MHMRMRYLLGSALGVLTLSANAAPASNLLNLPSVMFPSVVPVQVGESLVFDGFQNGNQKLIDARLGESVEPLGAPYAVTVEWGFTRLACVGQCIAGAQDSDPMFMLGVGQMLYGFMMSDDGGGTVFATTSNDGGEYVFDVRSRQIASGVGSNGVGDGGLLQIAYVVGSDFVTAEGTFNGTTFSSTWSSLDNDYKQLSLVFVADNDTGERYSLDSFHSAPAIPVPEPSAGVLLASGLCLVAMSRACRIKAR